jgi:MFS family permease
MSTATAESFPAPSRLFENRHFRNLILGGTVSMFGDQFYLVALPWLVLQLTGSSVALGTVLMLAAVPRAVLMLMGGAVSDRTSPRRVMLATASIRALLVAGIAALIWTRSIQMWHIYVLGFAFGIADAFAIPAVQSIMPTLVGREHLTKANSALQSSMQLTMIAGPAPAGFVIKKLGMMWAFVIDAVSFLFIIAALWTIPDPPKHPHQQAPRSVWHIMKEGVKYVHADIAMRSIIIFATVLNFCVMGPVMVGLAALAHDRFSSASAYGAMISAFAAGGLTGAAGAGLRKQRRRGIMLLCVGALLAVLLASVGELRTLLAICVSMFLMGVVSGYNNVHMTAWYQERVDPAMMGRVMSLRMFAVFGMMPISLAVAGVIAAVSLKLLFVSAGALMLAITMFAATQRPVREVD